MTDPSAPNPQRPRRRAARERRFDTSVPSPCVGICAIDDTLEQCIGCRRTIDEIREWPILDRTQKLSVLEHIETRKAVPIER
ncbi:DUF1289 domain-containing protein [Gammaproteobacteria bacterium]|nr:DUF1289 domain-containing protein [Gammaproteobacteria bacterium]